MDANDHDHDGAPAAIGAPAPVPVVPGPVALADLPASLAAPGTREEFRRAIACLLYTAHVVTSDDLDIVPLPADVTTHAEATALRDQGALLFVRMAYRQEDEVFDYFACEYGDACSEHTVTAVLAMLRLGRYPDVLAQLRSLPVDQRPDAVRELRRSVRSDDRWMNAYTQVRAYLDAPVPPHPDAQSVSPPSDAVCAAWDAIAMDTRQCARDVLVKRRERCLVKMHIARLFRPDAPPAPGHPTDEDAAMYWRYLSVFGTFHELETIFDPAPRTARRMLMQALRDAFPGWAPQRACGRVIESYDEAKLAELRIEWERDMNHFERNVGNYLTLTLDDRADRLRALCFLVSNYRARIPIALVYQALCREEREPSPRVFMTFLQDVWLPLVAPDRGAIIRDATILFRSFGDVVLDGFVFAAMPTLVDWPCEADTAFIGALMDISRVAETRGSLLRVCLEQRVPEGSQHMTAREIHQFLEPLWNHLQHPDTRLILIRRYIATWNRPITRDVRDQLICAAPGVIGRQLVDDAIKVQVEAAQARNARMRSLASRYAGRIQDEAAPADAPDDSTCVACTVNLRRVCFTPCGHIATCIACAANCRQTCPMCRAAFAYAQPCIVPRA